MEGRIVKGISWSAIQQFSTQIIQFIVTIILARLLTPSEFGIIAASMIVLSILQVINETGFSIALIQKLDRDETDFSSVFILNIIMGITLYFLVYLLSGFLSQLFKIPELKSVIKLLGLNLIISSFLVVQQAKLYIKVDFKTLALASLNGTVIGGIIGIIMAYKNFGVYALVTQSIISNFITVSITWIIVKWIPSFHFSLSRLKSFFIYAYKLIGARLVNTLFNQSYASVIALVYHPAELALFNRARSFETISTNNIIQVVQKVSIPLMCEAQNSKEDLKKITLKFIHLTSFIIFPLLVFLFTLAKPIILVLLTNKWIESVPILRIICFAGFFYVISAFNENLFNAVGKTGRAFRCEIVKKIVLIGIIAIAIILKNFDLLIWSFVICAFLESVIDVWYTKDIINAGYFEQLKGLWGTIILSFSMGVYIIIGKNIFNNVYIQLFVVGTTALIFYFILSYFLKIGPINQFILNKKKKNT